MDPYGRNEFDGMFPHFYNKQVVRELAPNLAVIYRRLVMMGEVFRPAGD